MIYFNFYIENEVKKREESENSFVNTISEVMNALKDKIKKEKKER